MRWRRLLALSGLLALGAAHPSSDRGVAYTLAPALQGDAIVGLDVTIRLHADASGTTVIDWGDGWAGEKKLAQWARDIRVEGGRVIGNARYGGRIVRSRPGAALTMRYRIVSAYSADPTVADSDQPRPVVRPDWFYAVGEVLYASPTGRGAAPARFAWEGHGLGFASDAEHAAGLGGHPRTVDDVVESIAIGGRDLAVSTTTLDGAPIRVAHVGTFGFDIAAFETRAVEVVKAERDFWGDRKAGPFLITAIPLAPLPGQLSYGGTTRGDGFATWIDRNAPLSGLTWLLAHEYFHSWNGQQLGRFPEAEAEAYWLSEGFTDFYARRLMLRSGLSTPEQFAEDWNAMLRAYAASPYRAVGNAEVAAKFWSGDYAAEKLPYQRGALLAVLWDRALKSRAAGLDAVLRAQRARAAEAKAPPEITSGFVEATGRAGLDISGDVARYLTQGAAVVLPEDAFGCARVETRDIPVFERGWDADATAAANNVLTGVDRASNAYAAGLRDGMKIVARKGGEPGNSAVDYVIEVQDGAATRTVHFRPAGKASIPTQQIVLDAAAFAADPERCRAALAG